MVVECSTCTVGTELTTGDGNDGISCFDEAIIEFVRVVVTSS